MYKLVIVVQNNDWQLYTNSSDTGASANLRGTGLLKFPKSQSVRDCYISHHLTLSHYIAFFDITLKTLFIT